MCCRIRDMSSPLSPDLHRRANVSEHETLDNANKICTHKINVGYLSGLI